MVLPIAIHKHLAERGNPYLQNHTVCIRNWERIGAVPTLQSRAFVVTIPDAFDVVAVARTALLRSRT